jgi:Tol biopolymer transport system component
LGPVVNAAAMDSCPYLTKDGLSLYFMSNRPGGFGSFDIYVSQRSSVDEAWGAPQNLGPAVNTVDNERNPYVTPDGHYLIFVSVRPLATVTGDFYISYRHDKKDDLGWEPPVRITAVSTPADEYAMSGFEEEGTGILRLYFSSGPRPWVGGQDIYTTTMTEDGVFSSPVPVSELSSTADDVFPTVSKDGLEMFLTSNRPGSISGSPDLWSATRENTSDPWSTPVNLGPAVNSASPEGRASLSWDGSTVFFRSDRPGGSGSGDLYQITRNKVTGAGK